MGKIEATCWQQSSPAVLQASAADYGDIEREKKFHRCCLKLQDTDAINKWKKIGRFFNISDSTIDMLKQKDKDDTEEQFYQMMRRWWQEKGTDATPEKLIEALKFANLRNVVDQVKISW